MNPSPGPPLPVEPLDDLVELSYSQLVVSDRRPEPLPPSYCFDEEQFFVDWQVPQA